MRVEHSIFPGTNEQQALLKAIVEYYRDDARILAVGVFGSLGRGTWDEYSDLDLDIIIADGVQIDAMNELEQLCGSFSSIGEKAALIIPDGEDAGDVVLESLKELSVRYHPLHNTKPVILESLKLLTGRIELESIRVAALVNVQMDAPPMEQLLDRWVRYAIEADAAIQRRRKWAAIELLQRMRGLLMELYARAHGQARSYQAFEASANEALQERLGKTLPQFDFDSIREALGDMLDLVKYDLATLSDEKVQLSKAQRAVLTSKGWLDSSV